jgi:enoyl-CoA hydratase
MNAALNSAYQTIELQEPRPGLLQIRLNRPEAANAINTRLGEELLEVFSVIGAAPDAYRCAILTAAGDRHFCAGADLKERREMTDERWLKQHHLLERLVLAMVDCPIPVVAAVNGVAFAGGCELVLCCDFAYAVETARFALTETRIGVMPGGGGTQLLPRAVGLRRAKELIIAARPFSAQEGVAWGLVNKLSKPGCVLADAIEIAEAICANAPLSVRQAKRSMEFGMRMDLRSALFFEIDAYNRLVPTQDRREGVLAFNERRAPNFVGR